MNNIKNCKQCNKIFDGLRDVCRNCFLENERSLDLIKAFLKKRENSKKTIAEVSEETGISIELIYDFIKIGRLSARNNPNFNLPCERCGKTSINGNFCSSCLDVIKKDLYQYDKEKLKKQQDNKSKTYLSSITKK